jgi:hypothetical protein
MAKFGDFTLSLIWLILFNGLLVCISWGCPIHLDRLVLVIAMLGTLSVFVLEFIILKGGYKK